MRGWALAAWVLGAGCGGSHELGRPNDPPEWPMGMPGHVGAAPAPAAPVEEPAPADPAAAVDAPVAAGGPEAPP